jgi:hypothetical protein
MSTASEVPALGRNWWLFLSVIAGLICLAFKLRGARHDAAAVPA